MSKLHKRASLKRSRSRKPSLAPRIFAILALLIILALAFSTLIPSGALR